ncbi:MAG: Arc family DNA-binding protein [Aquamicrobium sp.]|uniref:Arc family DNA-binding protein n=1 Tax=Aquamicrobium sp. TaxID=1872579 RepID=UPI00349E7D2A|nr:Arc family DNA-binding protein [Aquamicrobium sp.]
MSKEPIQPQDKYVLRLPDGMRDRIKAEAEKNNRSMNAEIVSRLSDSFDEQRIAQLMRERAENRDKQILYVALDADGLPISWQEIMLHLGEIGRSTGRDINSIQARVVDAQVLANDLRENFWWELVQKYRKARAPKVKQEPVEQPHTSKKPAQRHIKLDDDE